MSSVVIKWTDPAEIERAVVALAAELRSRRPEVVRIVWFGSWITGRPSAGSDVDLCLVLSSSDKPRHERLPEYLPSKAFPVGLDLFPVTEAELARLARESPDWHRTLTTGREL